MKKIINEFVLDKKVGLIGASADPKKWGNMLLKNLRKKGCEVFPVNLIEKEIEGLKCYASVRDLPKDVRNVILAVPADVAEKVVQECAKSGIKRVWLHKGAGGKGAVSAKSIELCKQNDLDVIYDVCPMMFYPPAGVHKFHLWIRKLRKGLPPDFYA